MFAIVVNEKGGEQKRLEFDKPEVTIGRVQGNDIILPKGNVSKRHSRIVLKDGKFIIVDLKSTNGTYVNGRKITSPLVVKGSDKIYIGDFILSIEDLNGANAGAGTAAAEEEDHIPPPPPRKNTTVPPPPPRAGDEDEESPPPPPARVERPSQPALPPSAPPEADRPHRTLQPSAPPPPAARVTAPREGVRPPTQSRPELPAQPPPPAERVARPTTPSLPQPAPAPTPAPTPPPPAVVPPAATQPAERPAARPAPSGRPPAVTARPARPVDEAARTRTADVLRELRARLTASLNLPAEFDAGDDELWSRAENAAGDLVNQLSSDSALPAGIDTEALIADAVAETIGLGPLEDLIADDTVRDITVAAPNRIFVTRDGGRELSAKIFSSADAVHEMLSRMMRRFRVESAGHESVLEGRIAGGERGLLMTAVLPPLAPNGPVVRLRRARRIADALPQLVADGVLTQERADTLRDAIGDRKNILVVGPAGSGRTTLLAALARGVSPAERVVAVVEADELGLKDAITLTTHGAGRRNALAAGLRLGPDRLIVDDVRGAEALDLVTALVAGARGAIFSVQASTGREALTRLEALARLSPDAPASEVLQKEIAQGIQLVVQLAAGAQMRVTDISEVVSGPSGLALRPTRD